ncbi:MAG: prepilin peptidase [Bdellovibrionaceae bacterium]|nr:prepilin peptidase [Bdellovibrionales bacterium]MCB9086098.1 prepilin peptidase [Pseudobdellovibrionaceae bacterium]
MAVTALTFFAFGAIFGSFGNVLIYRVPLKKNVAWPGSACPKCSASIAWYDNVPILSWLLLKGRCRSCKAPISKRYPLVEFLTGLAFAALYLRCGFSWILLEYLIFAFGLIVVTFIDLDHMILPDVFTWPGMALGLLGGAINPERSFMDSFLGAVLGFGFLYAIAYIYLALRKEEGMGGGDIKLLGWIGAILGWKSIPFVILASSIIGSVVGIVFAIRTKGGLKSTIPFGPYLVLAAFAYIFGGEAIGRWYLNLFLPGLLSPH